MVNKDVHLHTF